MNAFLNSVKADLLDRRLLAGVIALGVAFVAAVAFAVLGAGGGSTSNQASGTAVVAPRNLAEAAGISVSQAPPNPAEAVAETANGVADQSRGPSRDPFTPLPAAAPATTASSQSTSKASTASTHGASGAPASSSAGSPHVVSSSQGGGSSTPASAPTPSKPKPPPPAYDVAVLFGVVPPGTPVQSVQLTPFENLAVGSALPSSQHPLVVFKGVTANGKSATFTIAGEAILHGPGVCIPSASQCQAIELMPGQTEELESYASNGQATVYQLEVVSIATSKASLARAHASARPARISLSGAYLASARPSR